LVDQLAVTLVVEKVAQSVAEMAEALADWLVAVMVDQWAVDLVAS
jgi:hypothetical protein